MIEKNQELGIVKLKHSKFVPNKKSLDACTKGQKLIVYLRYEVSLVDFGQLDT